MENGQMAGRQKDACCHYCGALDWNVWHDGVAGRKRHTGADRRRFGGRNSTVNPNGRRNFGADGNPAAYAHGNTDCLSYGRTDRDAHSNPYRRTDRGSYRRADGSPHRGSHRSACACAGSGCSG